MAIWKQRSLKKRQELHLRRTQRFFAWNQANAPVQADESQANDDDSFGALINALIDDPRTNRFLLFLLGFVLIFYIAYRWGAFSIGNGFFNPYMMLFVVAVCAYDSFGIWYFQKR